MKKIVFLVLSLFMRVESLLAQEMEHGDHHKMAFQKPDEWVADTIIWVSVAIVVATLILTLKYLLKPKENDPNHIKNIIIDERF